MQNFSLNLLTFPFWWYTAGAAISWQWTKKHLHYSLQKTGLLMFAQHLGEPLYKDYTKSGRILSFFLRIILLIFKSLIFFVKAVFILLAFAAYFCLLPTIVAFIIVQLLPAK